jgi:hypothetical protein
MCSSCRPKTSGARRRISRPPFRKNRVLRLPATTPQRASSLRVTLPCEALWLFGRLHRPLPAAKSHSGRSSNGGFLSRKVEMLDLSMRIDGLPLRQLAITNGSLCDIRNSCRQLLRLGRKPSTEGQYAAIPCRETRLSILFSDCCPAVPDKNRGQTRNQSFTPNFRRNVGEDAQARSERCARTAVPSLLNSPATPNCLPT